MHHRRDNRPIMLRQLAFAPYMVGIGLVLAAAALLGLQGDDVLSGFVRLIDAPWACL